MLTQIYNFITKSIVLKRTVRWGLRALRIDISKLGNVIGCIEKNVRNVGKTIKMVNIGGGPFYKPGWGVLDFTDWKYSFLPGTVDWQHNLFETKPLPFADGTIEIIYCSHVIEHLKIPNVEHLFQEVYRVLEPGGIFRVTCPDFDTGYEGLARRDETTVSNVQIPEYDLWQKVMYYYGSNYWSMHLDPTEIQQKFETLNKNEFLMWIDELNEKIPFDWITKHQGHISSWTAERIANRLTVAGFSRVEVSAPGKSRTQEMRGMGLAWAFDHRHPEGSVYIETVKD